MMGMQTTQQQQLGTLIGMPTNAKKHAMALQ
jgi:hypothetical protein